MLCEIINCLFAGMGVGFRAFVEAIRSMSKLNGIKWEIVARVLGIPVLVAIVLGVAIKIAKKVLS